MPVTGEQSAPSVAPPATSCVAMSNVTSLAAGEVSLTVNVAGVGVAPVPSTTVTSLTDRAGDGWSSLCYGVTPLAAVGGVFCLKMSLSPSRATTVGSPSLMSPFSNASANVGSGIGLRSRF